MIFMRSIVFILISSLFILIACVSSKSLLDKGRYDEAIEKAVKKLKKSPQNKKEINVLEHAYKLANEHDINRINLLKKEGDPKSWNEIFIRYEQLNKRQNFVGTLPQNILLKIGYNKIDYDQEIINAKRNAAEYFYVHAQKLLESNIKSEIRKAYAELMKVKEYYPNYKDVDQLIYKAKELGTAYVYFTINNSSNAQLPPDFEDMLTDLSLYQFNDMWIYFENKKIPGRNYDYTIKVDIKSITISPEKISEKQEIETKTIDDGWQYVLDEKGNVKKDSAGNDIKIKKTKTIMCKVIETSLHKAAKIMGTIEFIDNNNSNTILKEPVTADSFFDYVWYNANGDLNALSSETRKKIEKSPKPIPFPSDLEMISLAGNVLKRMTKDIVYKNKKLLQ